MYEQKIGLLRLILGRVALTVLVVLGTLLALPSFEPYTTFLVPFLLAVGILSAIYLLLWRYTERYDLLYSLQFFCDLVLLSILIYFSGGIHSLFTPFYVLIIVYASVIRGREGGILALVLSIIFYLSVVHTGYFGLIQAIPQSQPYRDTMFRLFTNLLAFVSVAFLGILLSERLNRARDELGTARMLQENIINSMRSGLLTANLHGQVSFANRVAAELFECAPEEISEMRIDQLFSPEIFEQIRNHDYSSTARAHRLEGWVDTKGGRRVFLGLGCSPLTGANERLIGYLVSFQDLTEIKKQEEELAIRQKMAAIGEMAAGLAHELRNPLGSLSGSIQILRSELQLSPDEARLLDIVLRESERLNRIVSDFLVYAGPPKGNRREVDLITLTDETLHLFKNNPEFQADRHRIYFESLCTSVICLGDPDQLRQVVLNLAQNAIRAMPEGGTLTVSIDELGARALLRFRDTGRGMTPAEKERLFQPFHSRFRKGTGLGMAIVFQILQQHQGEIEIHSQPDQGTRIDVFLPKASGRYSSPPSPSS